MPNPTLSAVINTKNNAEILARTLESVKFADEIIVVDAHSTDETVKIAKQFTDKVYLFEGPNYVEPYRNFALSKASGDWLLVVDSDEVISATLRDEVLKVIESPEAAAYFLPRKNIIFGKEITHTGWWPDYQLRLFKKGQVTWKDEIHSIPEVNGESAHFAAKEELAILHHNYQSLEQFIERLNNYTSVQANERAKQGEVEFSVPGMMQAFSGEFVSRAFAGEGYLDGFHGLSLAMLQGLSELTVYLKQWEKQGFPEQSATDLPQALTQFRRTLNYWLADYQVKNTTGIGQLYWRIRRKWQI